MYMILRLPNRGLIDALVLSATAEHMRVVIPDTPDTIEFRLMDGHWTSAAQPNAEIECLLAGGLELAAAPCTEVARGHSAGSEIGGNGC